MWNVADLVDVARGPRRRGLVREDVARLLETFDERARAIAAPGFDERFRRMWRYDLSHCEGGFRAGRVDIRQIVLERGAMRPAVLRFDGSIGGARFTSGDTIVVGAWRSSPLGAFADVMWSTREGTRVLLAGDERVLDFVGTHYPFDERRLVHVRAHITAEGLRVAAGPITIRTSFAPPGAASRLLGLRPAWLRTWRPWIAVEDALLRPALSPLLGSTRSVRTRGRTLAGAREWYAIDDSRVARQVRGTLDGDDLGPVSADGPAARFGFSGFPSRAGAARVTSTIVADGPRSPREVER